MQTPFEAQLALERQGISAGSLDGKIGSQTRAAVRAFQRQAELPLTGELDANTKSNLSLSTPPLTTYVVTSNDLARLQPISKTWTGKSQQTTLDYETILELVAEKFHSHPALIKQMNPAANWTNLAAGTSLQVPDVTRDNPPAKAAFARISLSEKILEAFDAESNLLVHFPCSIARRVEKRPVGELHVAVVARNPNYTFDPQLFPEAPGSERGAGRETHYSARAGIIPWAPSGSGSTNRATACTEPRGRRMWAARNRTDVFDWRIGTRSCC